MENKVLDFSLGDPLLPFTALARAAFSKAMGDLHRYHIPGNRDWNSTVNKAAKSIADHLTSHGFCESGWADLSPHSLVITGNGTTGAYDLVIRDITQNAKELAKRLGQEIKPVIIMPVPTYGFFSMSPERHGIEVVKVRRDLGNGGKLNSGTLIETIRALDKQGKRVVAYYDSNPNNPLGTIRDEEQTRAIAKILRAMNHIYEERDGFRDPMGRIKIVDDLVYMGLEFPGRQKAFGFVQLDKNPEFQGIFGDTYTLFGLSKMGLVDMRAGMILGNTRAMDRLRRFQLETAYCPPKTTIYALEGFFSDEPKLKAAREKHLAAMTAKHEAAGKIMKDEINAIPGLRVITNPDAGFFHLIDFSGLKGRQYLYDNGWGDSMKNVRNLKDVFGIADDLGVHMATNEWMGLDDGDMLARVTFAKPIPEILEFCERLKQLVVKTEKPVLDISFPAPRNG